jgi:hypothetical protein
VTGAKTAGREQRGEDKTDTADQVEHDPPIHCERRFEPFNIRRGKGVLRNIQARLGKDQIGPYPHHKVCGDAEDNQRSARWIAVPVAEHQQADEQDFHCAVERDEKRNGRPHECGKDGVGRRRLAQRRGHHPAVHQACARHQSDCDNGERHGGVGKQRDPGPPAHQSVGDDPDQHRPNETGERSCDWPDNAARREDLAIEAANGCQHRRDDQIGRGSAGDRLHGTAPNTACLALGAVGTMIDCKAV